MDILVEAIGSPSIGRDASIPDLTIETSICGIHWIETGRRVTEDTEAVRRQHLVVISSSKSKGDGSTTSAADAV